MNQLRLQNVESRRNYFTATLMYKITHEIAPKRLIDSFTFTRDTHELSTRSSHNNMIQVPEPKLEIFKNSLKYQGPILWNSLPPQLKTASDIECFKRMYKQLYFKR